MAHTCHAPGCNRLVPPNMWGCKPHWFALPQKIRDAIWREYRPGQEIDKDPSSRYMAVQRLACAHSVYKPNDEQATLRALVYLQEAVRYSKMSVAEGLGDPLENLVPKDWPVKRPVKPPVKAKLRLVK